MLAFTGVRPGMTVLDVVAGGGYTSELMARAVAPDGRVYSQTSRGPSPTLAERTKKPAGANIVAFVQPLDNPVPPALASGSLDLVTLMFNYHDLGAAGVDRARMNAAIFAALKPGGAYVVADHSGRAGTGISESGTLHRVEETLVRREVEAAGFRLAAEGMFLRNPADPRDREEPDPPQPKDEFVLRYREALTRPLRAARALPGIGTPAAALTSFSTTLERMWVTPGSLNAVSCRNCS